MYECAARVGNAREILQQLTAEVEFPDIRGLVNSDKLKPQDILSFRRKSRRFRRWLKEEGIRDRNAAIAYHLEVARECGVVTLGRSLLRLFGVPAGALGGFFAGQQTSAPVAGIVAGALAGKGVEYLFEVASKLGGGWRPVVFGNWLKDRIEKLSRER
jgi:hypothetical protein